MFANGLNERTAVNSLKRLAAAERTALDGRNSAGERCFRQLRAFQERVSTNRFNAGGNGDLLQILAVNECAAKALHITWNGNRGQPALTERGIPYFLQTFRQFHRLELGRSTESIRANFLQAIGERQRTEFSIIIECPVRDFGHICRDDNFSNRNSSECFFSDRGQRIRKIDFFQRIALRKRKSTNVRYPIRQMNTFQQLAVCKCFIADARHTVRNFNSFQGRTVLKAMHERDVLRQNDRSQGRAFREASAFHAENLRRQNYCLQIFASCKCPLHQVKVRRCDFHRLQLMAISKCKTPNVKTRLRKFQRCNAGIVECISSNQL